MNLEQFSKYHHLKLRQDSCGESIIPGRPRKAVRQEDKHHIYDPEDGKHLGLCFLDHRPIHLPPAVKKYHNAQTKLLAAGFIQGQNAAAEGTFLFDPKDTKQAKLAIKVAGCREKRNPSPQLIAAGAKTRFKSKAPGTNDPD